MPNYMESNTGLNVANQYGARDTGNVVGAEHRTNNNIRVGINVKGAQLLTAVEEYSGSGPVELWIPPTVLPIGFGNNITPAQVNIYTEEAFTITAGTSLELYNKAAGATVPPIVIDLSKLTATGWSSKALPTAWTAASGGLKEVVDLGMRLTAPPIGYNGSGSLTAYFEGDYRAVKLA